ncbi:NAD-dependent epimerase/dehydratase family protein [Sphingomonas glaciei]|uniref:NAD-dependent epimerase/dehydratase family protein n=1 Tax=Sphingomonas glaciei TaxID=2938948 RepID=A0ABY5MY21_9SPHN|nr:NAD-dependent epimerase/dehydratase family protein [Sphingomonas glaciei]UUR07998.1 NAD-dependent epimerase/dehydratase family protein [Sphingomonas glaciei]
MKLAITGGTGFVGNRLLSLAVEQGHEVIALTRRSQNERRGVTWVQGALDNRLALQRLVEHADAVIHVAGVISAPDAAGFEKGNVTGTLGLLAAATASGVHRFVHVSSLAAREPKLSLYGASKARSEELVQRSGLDWAIVRPPAVYGPGDRETLELFKAARLGLVPLPPKGRISLIHVDDLSRLLLALAAADAPTKLVVEPDDGREGGWTHREFADALAAAQDRRTLSLSVPAGLVRLGARIDGLMRRGKAKLTPDRAAYFCHPDWTVDPARRPDAALWHPQIPTPAGLASTVAWYEQQGWL